MSFAPGELTADGFLGGRLSILQPLKGYRAATDPVLLAAAVVARAGEMALELGCGAGVASLCLALRVPGLAVAGLEAQANYAELARRNAAANALPVEVHTGSLARMPGALSARAFDHVLANPPWFPGTATPARDLGRDQSQRAQAPLADWINAGLRRLEPGGSLTMILSVAQLPEALVALSAKAGDIAVLPLAARAGRAAGRVILRARKGARGPFRLAAPFVLHDGSAHASDGDDHSAAAGRILRDGGALDF